MPPGFNPKRRNIQSQETDPLFQAPPSESPGAKTKRFCTLFWLLFFFVSLYGLVVTNVALDGLIYDRDCPSCTCPSPLTDPAEIKSSKEDLKKKLDYRDSSFTVFANNFIDDDSLRYCSAQCYRNFFTCPDKAESEKCKQETSIPEGCTKFDICLNECKQSCPNRNPMGKGLSENMCLNKFNYGLLCPR